MLASDIVRLGQNIFPEIAAHNWFIQTDNDHWCINAVFDRRRRIEIVIGQSGFVNWAVCQIVTKHEEAARTEIQDEREVFTATENNFIGWFSDVRSRFPLPRRYILTRNLDGGIFEENLVNMAFTVDEGYQNIEFVTEGKPRFPITANHLRDWMADGYITPYKTGFNSCCGCALERVSCGHPEGRRKTDADDCFTLTLPEPEPKVTMKDDWQNPIEPVERSLCGKCRYHHERNDGQELCLDHQTLGDFACTHYKPKDIEPPRTCPQCVNYIHATRKCRRGAGLLGDAPHCGDFAWVNVPRTKPSTQVKDCTRCHHYGGPGHCAKDEPLGTAPICPSYADKARGSTRSKDQCPTCEHNDTPRNPLCNLGISKGNPKPCRSYEAKKPAKMWPKCTTCKHLNGTNCSLNLKGLPDCDSYKSKPEFCYEEECVKCRWGVKTRPKLGWQCAAKHDPEAEAPCQNYIRGF